LNDEQADQVSEIYERMVVEFESDYKYKFDLVRNLIFELLRFAVKLEPSIQVEDRARNASQRISTLFMELLERQFPIDETHQTIKLRSASEFATQLNVHVNHLNRAIKCITQKTTTEHISGIFNFNFTLNH
jgi:hypothetical protein